MASQSVTPRGRHARSNAIGGSGDPRNPNTQQLFELQLLGAKPVADSLRSFLRKVWADKSIMQDPGIQKWPIGADGKPVSPKDAKFGDTLADKIYDLYTAEVKAPSGRTEDEMRKFIQVLQVLQKTYTSALAGIQSQGYQMDLGQMLRYKGADFVTVCNDFIFFHPVSRGGAVIRVYANAKYEKVADVVDALLSHIQANPAKHGMANFKIAGPAMPKRSDTIVIYCDSTQSADAIANLLLKLQNCFDMAVPEMTSRKDGMIGISTGAEPQWQATGLGAYKGQKYEANQQLQKEHGVGSAAYAPQSFGTIRSQAIAGAIVNFQLNADITGSGFEVFERFVSVAFTGLGLDPTNPGD